MSKPVVRTRFAPAPTGLMHLGNVRTALMNYIFAHQNEGTFIVRVEDTDQQRNFDPGAQQILADLAWLGLTFTEGPGKGGPYAPYFQSERTSLYLKKLQEVIAMGFAYRCFCTAEDLEKKRQRQLALKLPPRYDRTCLGLSSEKIEQQLTQNIPFIWRLKVPQSGSVQINDLARGSVTFEFKNFSDQPLSRQDGSITFLFANFVDDLEMHITHIFRGEDHLTNTAIQAILYKAFNAPLPAYWHMPILCNTEGKKLSKRDFGFSLNDLRQAGYLPEAICNYLALIGTSSHDHEIMDMQELIKHVDFTHISTASQIKYDVEKLTWVNHQWIDKSDPLHLAHQCRPILEQEYKEVHTLDPIVLANLLQTVKSDLKTLQDAKTALHFYFRSPQYTQQELDICLSSEIRKTIAALVEPLLTTLSNSESFMQQIKQNAKKAEIPLKDVFTFLRLALMGQTEGPSIHDLLSMLGTEEATLRLEHLCKIS